MTIRELARRHLLQNGMTPREAALLLESFLRGAGRDVGWEASATSLPKVLAERIDKVAVSWCMAHRVTGETQVEPAPALIRDGKMLATGETI